MNEFDHSSKPNHVDRHIGGRLSQARDRRGETPQFMARALKLRVVEYLQIEAGNRRLGAELMTRAADVLRVDVTWFFEGLATGEGSKNKANFTVASTDVVDLEIERLRRPRR